MLKEQSVAGSGPKVAFIDESKRKKDYLLCAVVVVPQDFAHIKKELKKARGPRSGIHMADRKDPERKQLAKLLASLDVSAYIFQARGANDRTMRDALLEEQMANFFVQEQISSAVFESCGQDREDRQVLRKSLPVPSPVEYAHGSKQDTLLALPDIHAWSWGRAGAIRKTVEPVTRKVFPLLDLR